MVKLPLHARAVILAGSCTHRAGWAASQHATASSSSVDNHLTADLWPHESQCNLSAVIQLPCLAHTDGDPVHFALLVHCEGCGIGDVA